LTLAVETNQHKTVPNIVLVQLLNKHRNNIKLHHHNLQLHLPLPLPPNTVRVTTVLLLKVWQSSPP